MPELIILRLHPSEPMDPGDFRALLTGLTIDAFDLSFAKPAEGDSVGSATGLADPHLPSTTDNTVAIGSGLILQHYVDVDPLVGDVERRLESVATAVIVVTPPAALPEYPTVTGLDLRLTITRGPVTRVSRRLHYNVLLQTLAPLSTIQKVYFEMAPSAFVELPALDPSVAFVDLPPDGQPPNFEQLVTAIDLVLGGDPGAPADTLVNRAPLTAAESRHVAEEIAWNRTAFPPPAPDPSLRVVGVVGDDLTQDPFGALYTEPPVEPFSDYNAVERARSRFEAELRGYYGTREAEALRLVDFVYSASAAVAEERLSIAAERARFEFPLITNAGTATTLERGSVTLLESGGLQPAFMVPATFFYALAAAMPTALGPAQRFDMARLALEERLLRDFDTAVDAGVVTFPAAPLTVAAGTITAVQAARRLVALGAVQTALAEVPLAPLVETLVFDWLGHAGPTATIDAAFWVPEVAAQPAAYLELLLEGATENHTELIAAIKGPPHNVDSVATLVAIKDQQWRDFFLGPSPPDGAPPRLDLLPDFTAPGAPAQRVEAFIRHLRTFFHVPFQPPPSAGPVPGAAPRLPRSVSDAFAAFMAAYETHFGGAFVFGTPPDNTAVEASLQDVFPGDDDAQAWLRHALTTISALHGLTEVGAGELRFSLIEALYARGFTSGADVTALSPADFQHALEGSVAYPYAMAIFAHAGGSESEPEPERPFKPVNPDGSLVDCVPPAHLSPLGPVEYLHELLQLSPASTCEDPLRPGDDDRLGMQLTHRRGAVGSLHATAPNLQTPVPVIDLVNESLEALTAGGTIHDTAGDSVAGHRLATDGRVGGDPYAHDPQTLLATVPEHSSPATPVAVPAIYDDLRNDFSHPNLPYAQGLDIARSYLGAMGTSRHSAMRHFRKDITEFAIDANSEPADFFTHLWRYPLRLEIALELLGISPEEYDQLYAADFAPVWVLYGFASDTVGGRPWTEIVLEVPEFLKRSGLDYCEFVELWHTGVVPFGRVGYVQDPDGGDAEEAFPGCEPCCPDDLVIDFGLIDPVVALRKLAVFVRLWRRLRSVRCGNLTMPQLRDVADVLGLFDGDSVNPEFARQLASLVVLREVFCLPLADPGAEVPADATGADRTHLLALWEGPAAMFWWWAVDRLLEGVEAAAAVRRPGLERDPELDKLRRENLDALSVLAGFDPVPPSTDTWHRQPTSTLRFAEVLLKIYVSRFTVGEVLFLFSNAHLDGDDPLALPTPNESLDDPLELPDDEQAFDLWALRGKLLEAETPDDEAWTWARISASLETEFGYVPITPLDPLTTLGERFFPSILEREGTPVPPDRRRFSVPLLAVDTTPLMWNTPPEGPFRYDTASQQLWSRLPLSDAAVAERLSTLDPLNAAERAAVRDLYFGPRVLLVPFALLFENFEAAVHRLVHAADDQERFAYVRAAYVRFHRRCEIVAEHLADHVASAAQQPGRVTAREVLRLLRELHGDENAGVTPWEDDSGRPPPVQWPLAPTGGAFAALLGLLGTGLVGTFAVPGTDPAWRELRGPMTAFGAGADEWNAPVPTVIPAPDLTLTLEQLRLVTVRNGFALRDVDGEPLFGAQPFSVTWSGALLIEEAGPYRFLAGAPTAEGEDPDPGRASDHRWRLRLRRGQREWTLLNYRWPGEEAPDHVSAPLELRRGVYRLTVDLEHPQPDFVREEDISPRHTGFQVKYAGPDTNDAAAEIPRRRLYRERVDAPLGEDLTVGGAADAFLRGRYTSSLRDIRRTYQRAFKAVLLAHRFELSAEPPPGDRQSELGYLLEHPEAFAGRTHPRTGPATFGTHLAWFAPDLLPVSDPYQPPPPPTDDRENPSAKRQAALFDWWERLYDYGALRAETRRARDRPAWRLFYEASERRPDEPVELVRHLGVDIRHAPLVLTYFDEPADYTIVVPDLETEGWAIRTWRGEVWLDRLERCFLVAWIGDAKPARWAADDPNEGPDAGNENLTRFVRFGAFENGPPRRYEDVRAVNDGLRTRARDALVAYLTSMGRVPLPYVPGTFAERARDLGDLLLQDVETGTCQRASRIEEAISSIHAFVQRARLGLEPSFVPTPAFSDAWDKQFASFHDWRCCAERTVHRENWIEWEELRRARKVEAFRFLEDELREAKLTVPVPGGLEWWPGRRPPDYASLTLLQRAEPSRLRMLTPGPLPEGLYLLGTPERDARPSWLAPTSRALEFEPNGDDDNGDDDNGDDDNGDGDDPDIVRHAEAEVAVAEFPEADLARLPLWLQAAVRLGVRFVRVAAAGEPPADSAYEVCEAPDANSCCASCGCHHEPLVDEYYFWLQDAETYGPAEQDADVGVGQVDADVVNLLDETSDWHRPEQLPSLLHWPRTPAVHLHWSRMHHGEFEPPRRSSEPVVVDPSVLPPGEVPELEYKGRTADSLRFEVSGGMAPLGYLDATLPGFRYDLATDSAVALPLVAAPPAPPGFPGGLDAYPYFAYVCPGAPVQPVSLFSVAATVAGTLRARCRFESALKWYALEFDPLTADLTWQQCPQPENGNGNGDDNGDDNGDPIPIGVHQTAPRLAAVVQQRRGDLPCCPTAARDDDVARHRALLLGYLETMLEWGDALMCRHAPEAFRQADVIFHTMAHVLGERPLTVVAQDYPQPAATIDAFIARPAGLNPRLLALYDRTADRLTLLHDCHNGHRRRNGRPVTGMPYFGDDTRVDGWHAADCRCECDECCSPCCEPYRFTILAQRALDLAGDVRSLGAQLLAAYERGDAEYLASLRAAHERQLLELTLSERQDQWREADWQAQSLRKSKESAQTRLRYYQNLIAADLIGTERGYESSIGVSTGLRAAANISSATGQAMVYTPDFSLGGAGISGSPLQFNQLPVGNKLATYFTTAAHVFNTSADIAGSEAQLSLTQAGWERREQEWRHQVDVLTIEIEEIERQILAAERRRDIALRELNNHQRQIDNSRQVQDFLRDRFTSHELYLFLQQNTAALHSQYFELALCAARAAQRAFNRERGHTNRTFLPPVPWDSLQEGLLAGEGLHLAVRQMQQAYAETYCREYELTKHVSLRLQFPMAFLELVATGRTEIELPEWLFDLDYPGHYMRRIKNVSVTIPAVVGPYSGVHCRLTLLSSQLRVDPRLRPPDAECCHERCDCRCSEDSCCCALERSGYALAPDDNRLVRTYGAREAIATSSGQNDSGLFQLDFRDERCLPFEYEGAVARWRIELPLETNFFDVADTLADFIIHLNYTAREGGEPLRAAAAAYVRCRLPGDGLRLLDVRRDLPDAWAALQAGESRDWARRFDLRPSSSMFPFVPQRRPRWLERLQILVEAPCADPGANAVVRFVAGPHEHDGPCDCARMDVRCVGSGEYPGLFWGEVALGGQRLGPLGDGPTPVGTFEFPEMLGEICDVYLVAAYCAEPWTACGHGTHCPCRDDPCCCGDQHVR